MSGKWEVLKTRSIYYGWYAGLSFWPQRLPLASSQMPAIIASFSDESPLESRTRPVELKPFGFKDTRMLAQLNSGDLFDRSRPPFKPNRQISKRGKPTNLSRANVG